MRSQVFQRILDKTPKEVEIFVRLYGDIVVRVNHLLKENGYSQKKLAEKLEKKPSEISKWLNGEHNLTLKSIAKLEAELGAPIIYIPRQVIFQPMGENNTKMTIYRNDPINTEVEYTNVSFTRTGIEKREPHAI